MLDIKTSRKSVNAEERNKTEVMELVSNCNKYAEGIRVFKDRADKVIYVDTLKGLTAEVQLVIDTTGAKSLKYNYYEDGSTSKKNNGYVYTPISIMDGDKVLTIQYGTHSLVNMLAHTDGYLDLVEQGKSPVTNHKNNRPWDNSKENIEWTTKGGNIRHGKIVASLYHHYDNEYAHIEHNLSDTDFIVLNKPLSVKDIELYCELIDNGAEFKVAKDNEYIDEYVLSGFVSWLTETGRW